MALSRFYQPAQYQYMSQFVPRNLELMDRGIQRAQAKQDKQLSKLDELQGAILKQQALQGFDTQQRDAIVGEVKDFSTKMSSMDLSSPENFRAVNNFVQQMAVDPRLTKINQGLASKAKYDKIKEDLVTKGHYATENDRVFMQEYEKYLTQPSEQGKFAIDFIGGKELIAKDAPSRPELEKFVDNVHASGYTYDSERGIWIDRKSRKGISEQQLMNVLGSNLSPFSETAAGRQMMERAKMYNRSYKDQFLSEIVPIAKERAYSEASDTFRSNAAHLLNTKKLTAEEAPLVTQPLNTLLTTHGVDNLIDYDRKVKSLKDAYTANPNSVDGRQALKDASYMEGNRDRILNTMLAENKLSRNEMGALLATFDSIKDKPNLLKQMYRAAFTIEGGLENITPAQQVQELQNLEKQKPGFLNNLSKQVVATSLGFDLPSVEKKIDDAIAQGIGIEKQELLLPAERQKDKGALATTAVSLLDNLNFTNSTIKTDATNSGDEVDLEMAVQKINRASISMVNEDGRQGIKFSTLGTTNTPSVTYEVYPNQKAGEKVTSAFDNFVKFFAKNETDYTALSRDRESQNFKPVGRNSNISQTADMGLDPDLINDWNIQYPPAGYSQKGVTLNSLETGALKLKDVLGLVDGLDIAKSEKNSIVHYLASNSLNGKEKLNLEDPIIFTSPIEARDFLKDLQKQVELNQSKK